MPSLSLGSATVRRALADATAELDAAGCATPRLDAEVLLAHVLGADRAALHRAPERAVSRAEGERFRASIARRAGREPVAYIVGRRGFRFLELDVDPRVLIPRPETELVVEVALALLAPGARVVDVGTGSGAIALALAHERPDLAVWATDSSLGALRVAAANAARLGLAVDLRGADLLDGVPAPLDAVLANPPYVEQGADLPPEVADHEPPEALLAGPDGLGVLRRLIPAAAGAAPLVAVEVGAGQAPAVRGMMGDAGLPVVEVHRDLAGTPRVVVGRRA